MSWIERFGFGMTLSSRCEMFDERPLLSAWNVAPKAISVVVSYEAERRAVEASSAGRRRYSDPAPSPRLQYRTDGDRLDGMPTFLLSYPSTTLARLGELNDSANFDRRRLRPNFLVSTPEGDSGFTEASWCGRSLEIGKAVVHCEMPTVRCSMTTHEQEGLPKDPSVLRTIVRDGAQNVGVYATVVRPGAVAVGDEVRLA